MMMRKVCSAGVVGLVFLFAATFSAANYNHEIKDGKMTFAWTVEGSTLAVKLSAKTEGWVAIGFNPSKAMKDANYILGYVKKGKAKVVDHFGDKDNSHSSDKKLGGSEDVILVGGSEEAGVTTVEFTIPLDSGDRFDQPLDSNGETVVLLAYGAGRDSFRSKHKYRSVHRIVLASGAAEKLK